MQLDHLILIQGSHKITMAAQALIATLLLICALVAGAAGNSDVDALIAFKGGLQDPRNALDSWDPNSADPCTWFLVSCDDSNRVSRLSLAMIGISGTISPRLADLTSLQFLELFGNQLTGSIPQELGSISSLIALHVHDNELTGPIPSQLTDLSNLQFLNLSNNQLSGPIPQGGSFSRFSADSFQGNPNLCGPVLHTPC